MGSSTYLKQQNEGVQIIGLQPLEGDSIPGIRRWPTAYMPKIYDAFRVDRVMEISQETAENTMRRLATEEGIFCGVFLRCFYRGCIDAFARTTKRRYCGDYM